MAEAWRHAGGHAAGEAAESSPSGLADDRNSDWYWAWPELPDLLSDRKS